jgi:hypothetical protein
MREAKAIRKLIAEQNTPKAWIRVNAALNDDPDNPELLYLAGSIMRDQGHVGLALPLLGKALSFDGKQPNLWMHYGATLHDLNQWDDAIKAFQVVAQMLPTDPMPPANISASYSQKGKWHDTIKWADKALSLDPENYIAHIARSLACLALGRWAEGWKSQDYLYGHHLVVRVYNDPANEEQTWDGSPGKTVVVQCDQGLGDILMFGQCLPQMVADCKEVILECAERLVPLMKRNFPACTVYGTLKHAGQDWSVGKQIDAHIHISALPKFYRNSDLSFPRKPYITADQTKVDKWRAWLADKPKPWIGVSWQGGIQQTQKHLRSIALADLAPVLEQPGTHIDLSYRDNSAEVAAWNARGGAQVISPPIDQTDYEDTVALLVALDDVVTVTTTVVHACGALGRSARVLVNAVPMWRYAYRTGDNSMIWYPPDSVHLYRMTHGEQWGASIKRLANDMKPRILVAA